MKPASPIRPTDDTARALAQDLLNTMRFGALAVTRHDSPAPTVSRIALVRGEDGAPLSLISDLAEHATHLRANPDCAVLVGEPGDKGDPLTHPRITLQCRATFVDPQDPERAQIRAHYLSLYPKAQLYVDFTDFHFVRFCVSGALLNGGFGKAFRLSAQDLLRS